MLHFSQLLTLLWKLSTVYIIPIIILSYVSVLNSYLGDFTFANLDQGQNPHKLMIFAFYLMYLFFWKRANPWVVNHLRKLEY